MWCPGDDSNRRLDFPHSKCFAELFKFENMIVIHKTMTVIIQSMMFMLSEDVIQMVRKISIARYQV